MATVKLIYPGMKKSEQEAWLASQRKAFRFPTDHKYRINKKVREDEKKLAKAEMHREKYTKDREKEWADKLMEIDSFKSVAGVFFKKGEAKEIDTDDPQVDMGKLMSLVGLGVLKRAQEKPAKTQGGAQGDGGKQASETVVNGQSRKQGRQRAQAEGQAVTQA